MKHPIHGGDLKDIVRVIRIRITDKIANEIYQLTPLICSYKFKEINIEFLTGDIGALLVEDTVCWDAYVKKYLVFTTKKK